MKKELEKAQLLIENSAQVLKALDILVEYNFFTYISMALISEVLNPGYASTDKSEVIKGIDAYNQAVHQVIQYINTKE